MQNAEVKFGPQRAEVIGQRKLHNEEFQNYRLLPRIFYWRGCGAGRVAVCNFGGNGKKKCVIKKRARGRPKKNWMEDITKAMNERNLNEGQWEDRKQWSLGVGERRKAFLNRYMVGWFNTLV